MPSGPELLMKSMGFDPAEMKSAIQGFKNLAAEVKARQERIETKLDEILAAVHDQKGEESKDEFFTRTFPVGESSVEVEKHG